MKYGEIAANRSINSAIYKCFAHIPEEDARPFVRKFSQQADDETQRMHTFRELLLGGFLGRNGFRVKHELLIDGKTPDWSILNSSHQCEGVVELINFHTDRRTERAMEMAKEDRGIWTGRMPPNLARLHSRLGEKAVVYEDLWSL